jgi:hypothetical protein
MKNELCFKYQVVGCRLWLLVCSIDVQWHKQIGSKGQYVKDLYV